MLPSDERESSNPEKLGQKHRRQWPAKCCVSMRKYSPQRCERSYGLSRVAKIPRNRVGNSIGYCCAVRIRMSSITIAGKGARGPPLSTVLASIALKERK